MDIKEYRKRKVALLDKVLSVDNDFCKLVRDYYDSCPNEKGNKNTDFYREMMGMIDTFERCIESMKYSLDEPNTIQRIPVGD